MDKSHKGQKPHGTRGVKQDWAEEMAESNPFIQPWWMIQGKSNLPYFFVKIK